MMSLVKRLVSTPIFYVNASQFMSFLFWCVCVCVRRDNVVLVKAIVGVAVAGFLCLDLFGTCSHTNAVLHKTEPHVGHAHSSILADCIARWRSALGEKVRLSIVPCVREGVKE